MLRLGPPTCPPRQIKLPVSPSSDLHPIDCDHARKPHRRGNGQTGQIRRQATCEFHTNFYPPFFLTTNIASDSCDGSHHPQTRPCPLCHEPEQNVTDTRCQILARPRITISIIAPNHALDQEFITLDLPPGLSIADLKGFVTAETDLPQASQQFYLNNVAIQGDGKTLEEAGIKDGDMLAMLMRQPNQQQNNNMGTQRRPPQPSGQRRPPAPNTHEIETTRLGILGNPAAMAQVREQRPALAEAIHDSNRFKEVWMEMLREDDDRERERQEQMRLLNEDPFNIDAQRKIEEMIRQQAVQSNLQYAYENNPEGEKSL